MSEKSGEGVREARVTRGKRDEERERAAGLSSPHLVHPHSQESAGESLCVYEKSERKRGRTSEREAENSKESELGSERA